MYCDKIEKNSELNPNLKINLIYSTSNSEKKEQRVDISPCKQIPTLNKPIQTDCPLLALNRCSKQLEYESEPMDSIDASDLTPKTSGTQSHDKYNNYALYEISALESVQIEDLPFEKRRRQCRTKYTRNLGSTPHVGWKKRIRGFFRDIARQVRIYFST
ncbi:hypothetical protein NPIL_488731 [Nephila pilipes]|uniref:Uncharacterized protein n=1 Tax=Nephila pilipes TaxID=299642 RepID=A0A8X6PNQ0_NEPPI|nr:hypothetical protein NPIL_488731 [Nephila pilipes]